MERGNAKHSPREDDMLSAELSGTLGRGGSNREEWVDPEGPADDDPEVLLGPPVGGAEPSTGADTADADSRTQHEMDVANDWHDA